MQKCAIISVGRLKISFWREGADYYRQKLRHTWKINEIQVKDAGSALRMEERKKEEAGFILSALATVPQSYSICLDEHGEVLTSKNLAGLLQSCAQKALQACFIIGGAYGLAPQVLKETRQSISLSPLTFTHELAQVILWEQLYRADSILRGAAYHHE
jgi:23S rRNA (pseudouridine1915-N3)-methyltransferase